MENENQVVNENVETVVEKPVKVKKEKEIDILLSKLNSETSISIDEVIVDTTISIKKAKTILRNAEKKGLVKRVQTEKKSKFTYLKV